MTATAPAAGWFDDPHGGGQLRWWDGSQWTEHLTPHPEPAPTPTPAPHLVVAGSGTTQPQAVVPASLPAAASASTTTPTATIHVTGEAPSAQRALVAGIIAFFFNVLLIPSIIAIRASRAAKDEIAASGGRLGGEGKAKTGAILGWFSLVVAVLQVAVLMAVVVPLLLGGGSGSATLTNASGPPLTPQAYAQQMQQVGNESPAMDSLDPETATAEQYTAAAAEVRAAVAGVRAINPPVEVKAEHDLVASQLEQFATGLDGLATKPKDQAAAMSVFTSAVGAFGTMATIEQKLGVQLDVDDQGKPRSITAS